MIAVHAGLEKDKAVDEQLKTLKARDTRVAKVGPLCGRASVWEIPKVRVHQILHFIVIESSRAFHLQKLQTVYSDNYDMALCSANS